MCSLTYFVWFSAFLTYYPYFFSVQKQPAYLHSILFFHFRGNTVDAPEAKLTAAYPFIPCVDAAECTVAPTSSAAQNAGDALAVVFMKRDPLWKG